VRPYHAPRESIVGRTMHGQLASTRVEEAEEGVDSAAIDEALEELGRLDA
jgi:hypothetical protein